MLVDMKITYFFMISISVFIDFIKFHLIMFEGRHAFPFSLYILFFVGNPICRNSISYIS